VGQFPVRLGRLRSNANTRKLHHLTPWPPCPPYSQIALRVPRPVQAMADRKHQL